MQSFLRLNSEAQWKHLPITLFDFRVAVVTRFHTHWEYFLIWVLLNLAAQMEMTKCSFHTYLPALNFWWMIATLDLLEMMFLTKNKKIFVLVWITMIFNWLIGTTANWRIPNEKVQIQNSVRTYPQVHNCVLVHLLIKLNFKVGGGEYFTVWNSLFGKSRYWFTYWAWYGRVENRRCLMIQGSFRNV